MFSALVSQTFPIVESCLGSPRKIPFRFVPLRKDPDGTQSPTGGLLKIIEERSSITRALAMESSIELSECVIASSNTSAYVRTCSEYVCLSSNGTLFQKRERLIKLSL